MSERTLDTDLKTGAESAEFNYVVLVDLSFPSGNVRLHNSVGTISFGGNDYLGVGGFGAIEAINESVELVDQPINLTLSSITPEIITAMQDDDIYNRDADIYIGALDSDGNLKGTPTNWISGYMEKASLNIGTQNAVNISIQTYAAKLNQRNNKRFTIEEHQAEFPGDVFLEFLPYVVHAEVPWGGDKVRTGYTNTSDGIGGGGDLTIRGDRGLGPRKGF